MFQRRLLTDSDIERLADSALTILEKVGIICQNTDMLRALDEWGAIVDYEGEVARFPRKRVEEFAAVIREERAGKLENGLDWSLGFAQDDPRKGKASKPDDGFAVFQAPPRPTLGTQVAQFCYDDATGERNPGTREDLITLIRLGDTLHPEEGSGHSLIIREAPPLIEPLEAALTLAEYSRKPGPGFAWDVRQVDCLIEMGDILGIPDWFTMGAVCFAHPLRFDRDVAARVVRMAKMGHAVGLTGMQISGASTPVTVAGFVAVASAEFVAAWIAARALNPTVPLGGSVWAATIDMRNAETSFSAPDAMLRSFATNELLTRWTGHSVAIGGGEYSAAKVPGLYAALEKAYKAMMIAAFTGEHPGIGQGMVDSGKTISPVQMILDTEYTIALESLGQPVEVTPEMIGMDEILSVGFGITSNHLFTEHTLHHYRDSFWLPQVVNRSGYAGFEDEKAILEKARKRVADLIATYEKPRVDPDKLAKMRQVVDRARKELLA